jgi:hypothetical protein
MVLPCFRFLSSLAIEWEFFYGGGGNVWEEEIDGE